VGPARERELWQRGFHSWDQLPPSGTILSPRLDDRIRQTVAHRRELLACRDLDALAGALPLGEHWRLWPYFQDRACFLDIETDGFTDVVTSVGLLTPEVAKAYVRGFDLEALDRELARHSMVVTFNGAAFDLPVLRRAFPGISLPRVHLDLRVLLRKLGETGGLKRIEERLGLSRPGAVQGVDGYEAVLLWRRWREIRDEAALFRLVEYNLYDAILLRPLLDIAYNRMVRETGLPAREIPVFDPGVVGADVSRTLALLASRVGRRSAG
jgi:uncharacterized protein YprB with RNaseH-like and TPR domain